MGVEMTKGDLIQNSRNGRYGIVVAETTNGMVSVVQVWVKPSGGVERESRTTWRTEQTTPADLSWMAMGYQWRVQNQVMAIAETL